MINIIIHGCYGRMGRILHNTISSMENCKIVAGVDISANDHKNSFKDSLYEFPVYTNIEDCSVNADIVIDFTNYKSINGLVKYCIKHKLPVVIATTALGREELELLEFASSKIPIFYSSNMSVGINAIVNSIEHIVPHLEEDFNMEIIEKHHINKIDSPSGTALLLANTINEASAEKKNYLYGRFGKDNKCNANELCIHSVRGGTICGEHTIVFAGYNEVIEITHRAYSRDIFAIGAIRAAKFLINQENGLYSMSNLIS